MAKPRGRVGQPGTTSRIVVRLPSKEIHRQIYDASRGKGQAINEFAVDAISSKLSSSRAATESVSAARAVNSIQQCKSDDAFDLITIDQLSAIARAAKVSDSQAYVVIKELMQQLSR